MDRRYPSPAIDSVKVRSKALQYLIFNTSLSVEEKSNFLPIANVNDPHVTAVYNPQALQRLVILKQRIKQGENITLVMNGGSSSAHVPDGDRDDLYYRRFVHQFLKPELNATVDIIDRAHGSRNSAHSAHLITSFFPNHTDIVIWEFSINDGHSAKDVRNAFILWLRNVAARQETPPLVILLYLWKSPFDHDEKGKVRCRTFDQHQMIGAEYDFVLGHVNMAAYFDSLQWGLNEQKQAFIADAHHPNALTHHTIAKLLWQLVSKASESYKPVRKRIPKKKTDFTWTCGGKSIASRMMRRLFADTKGVAKASYTIDLPRNKDGTTPLMLLPSRAKNLTTVRFGRLGVNRMDRQRGLVIPCCNATSRMSFNVARVGEIQAVMLALRCPATRKDDLRIFQDGVKVAGGKKLIRPWNWWHCLLGGYNMNIGEAPSLDADFLLMDFLKLKRKMTTIGFCDTNCDPFNPIPLVYLSLF